MASGAVDVALERAGLDGDDCLQERRPSLYPPTDRVRMGIPSTGEHAAPDYSSKFLLELDTKVYIGFVVNEYHGCKAIIGGETVP